MVSAHVDPTLAIVNAVKTNHRCIAVCEMRTYDVWGNAKDGWDVNDVSSSYSVECVAEMIVYGAPRHPGASDAYRSFPSDTNSPKSDCLSVCFEISDKEIRKAFGVKCAITTDGDDMHITVDRERDGYPIGELTVVGWKDCE